MARTSLVRATLLGVVLCANALLFSGESLPARDECWVFASRMPGGSAIVVGRMTGEMIYFACSIPGKSDLRVKTSELDARWGRTKELTNLLVVISLGRSSGFLWNNTTFGESLVISCDDKIASAIDAISPFAKSEAVNGEQYFTVFYKSSKAAIAEKLPVDDALIAESVDSIYKAFVKK